MDNQTFDRLIRGLATGSSRRSLLRRAAGSAVVTPLALLGVEVAGAQRRSGRNRNKDRDRDRDRDEDRDEETQLEFASGCRDVGHPCVGDQECCLGLTCMPSGNDATFRCTTPLTSSAAQSGQTVLTSNQVCAGDCDQTNQQAVGGQITQTVIGGSSEFFGRPPTYRVDVNCAFDAPKYLTTCTGASHGDSGAPRVHKINLPSEGICALLIREETRPESERPRDVVVTGDNQATAGSGGVASADASGGSVAIGDIGGDSDVAIDASGGTASADASGGDNNIAIAGGQVQVRDEAQVVEPSTVTLTFEGKVVPGRQTTYWLETDAGLRPASGPALVQVADEPADTGAIVVEARTCPVSQAQQGFDWFGQCAVPVADMRFSVYPETGDSAPIATMATTAQGRARFGNLPPGTYQVVPEDLAWCYAESDRVDANGNVRVETDLESHVWSFVCGGSAGS